MGESREGGSVSTKPYLIRALYEWCGDNGLTPYLAVSVDDSVRVPREYVKDGEIVLNISMDATSALRLGNDFIEFKARFAGVARDILIPVQRVMAIYARENGQGMAFPLEEEASSSVGADGSPGLAVLESAGVDDTGSGLNSVESGNKSSSDEPDPPRTGGGGGRPALKRVK